MLFPPHRYNTYAEIDHWITTNLYEFQYEVISESH